MFYELIRVVDFEIGDRELGDARKVDSITFLFSRAVFY